MRYQKSDLIMHLPRSLYLQKETWLYNQKDLFTIYEPVEKNFVFSIQQSIVQNGYMTYHSNKYKGFLSSVLNTPLAGASIIGTILLNAPPLIFYREVYNLLTQQVFFHSVRFYPNEHLDSTKDYVKRVIALEGDVVEIIDKKVFVNNKLILQTNIEPHVDEDDSSFTLYKEQNVIKNGSANKKMYNIRLAHHLSTPLPSKPFPTENWPLDPNTQGFFYGESYKDHFGPITVPKRHYFVMGDNRDESFDSRYWGFVPRYAIKGTPMIRILPFSRMGGIY